MLPRRFVGELRQKEAQHTRAVPADVALGVTLPDGYTEPSNLPRRLRRLGLRQQAASPTTADTVAGPTAPVPAMLSSNRTAGTPCARRATSASTTRSSALMARSWRSRLPMMNGSPGGSSGAFSANHRRVTFLGHRVDVSTQCAFGPVDAPDAVGRREGPPLTRPRLGVPRSSWGVPSSCSLTPVPPHGRSRRGPLGHDATPVDHAAALEPSGSRRRALLSALRLRFRSQKLLGPCPEYLQAGHCVRLDGGCPAPGSSLRSHAW